MKPADPKTKYLLMGGIFLAIVAILQFFAMPFDLFREKGAFLNFCILTLGFTLLTFFLVKRDLTNLVSWWSVMIVVQFAIAPILCDFLGISFIDSYSVQALVYIFLGTACLWAGARLVQNQSETNAFSYDGAGFEDRRVYVGLIMLALGGAAKLYMLRAGLFLYVSDLSQIEAASRYREFLNILGELTIFAQIVLSIEFFRAPKRPLLLVSFWLTTIVNLGFALVSGMKAELMIVPLLILLVRKLTLGRLDRRLVMGLAALLVVIFPLNAAYRSEVHNEGAITSVEVGKNAIGRAVGSVSEGTKFDYISSSIESGANRMNLIPVIVFLDQEHDIGGTSIEGEERLWMIPFYPFVPRFLWKDKPVLEKGRRLSVAMGSTEYSSTAVTPFGDLIATGGLPALFIGMIGMGVVIQLITNLVMANFGSKALFIYCVLFAKLYAPEMDIMMFGTTLIQTLCVTVVVAYLVYGGRLFRLGSAVRSSARFAGFRHNALRPGAAFQSRARR